MYKTTAATVAALAVALAVSATAYAGNGRSSGSSWIGLSPSGASAPTSAVSGTVTLYEGTDATVQPFVHLMCYQNGSLVLEGWQAVFTAGTGSASFTLSSPAWKVGTPAACTAYLENWDSYSKNGKITTLASTSLAA